MREATISGLTIGRSRALAVPVVAAALLSVCACSVGTPPKVIKIGVDLPLAGADGRAGMPVLNGAQFYFDRNPTVEALPSSLSRPTTPANATAARSGAPANPNARAPT